MSKEKDVIFAGLRQLHQLSDDPLPFDVVGNSMWPTLHSADKVLIKSANTHNCGDLLLFYADDRLIVHRLQRIEPSGRYITKGDNRRALDAPVSAEQILGRVTAIVRNGKTIPIRPQRQSKLRLILQYSWLLSAVYRRLPL
jgi:signal peptidase I